MVLKNLTQLQPMSRLASPDWLPMFLAWPIRRLAVPLLHTFNGPFSGATQVSQYQKDITNLDFTEDSEWQWHQLGHMQVYTSQQTDYHASTHHSVFYRPDALPAAQPTASKH